MNPKDSGYTKAAARVQELTTDNERWRRESKKANETLLKMTAAYFKEKDRADKLEAELEACRQAAFENGRKTGERTAGYGELEY